jgi:tetratricopeptide (TPR) repeat protein
VSLDDIFDPGWSAVDLFTDRIPESTSFSVAAVNHLSDVLADRATLLRTARTNVLAFYGVGGIGKTELSHRLERWMHGEVPENTDWPDPLRLDHQVRTARLDLHGSHAFDAVGTVLALRNAVGGPGRPFPAFDLGLAAWWTQARPGVALPEFRNRAGFDLRGQIIDTVGDAIGQAGYGLAAGQLTARVGLAIVDAIRRGRLRDRWLRDCEPLAAIAREAERDASPWVAATLAGLLSWDLERLVRSERSLVVAFADAVEYIQGGDRSQERLLNRIVHLTPGVLWVMTTRRSLEWADPAVPGLAAVGAHVWPGLSLRAEGEPRQHLVGDLADHDVVRFLERASGHGGNPELSGEVIGRIRDGAHGLPLYLDLALSVARQSAGVPPPELFGGPLPALVGRILADLPEAERDVARTASLLPWFDPALLAEASGRSEGDAVRFCARTLVNQVDHPWFGFRLHDAVRAALRDESGREPGAWTSADRRRRADGLISALHVRHDETPGDVDRRLAMLEVAAQLCADHDLQADWLRRSLFELPGMARTAERLPPPDGRTWMGALSRFFSAYPGRSATERIAYFRETLEMSPPPDVARATRIFICYALRDSGKAEEALEILGTLRAAEPESSLIRYQFGRTLLTLRRFDEVEQLLREAPPTDETEVRRLRSDLAWEQGDLAEAVVGPRLRAKCLRRQGRHRVARENESAALWREAVAGLTTVDACDEMAAECDQYGLRLSLGTAITAKAVLQLADDDAVLAAMAELDRMYADSPGSRWRRWTLEALRSLRRGDEEPLDRIAAETGDDGRSRGAGWVPLDRTLRYAGLPSIFADGRPEAAEPLSEGWRVAIAALVRPAL